LSDCAKITISKIRMLSPNKRLRYSLGNPGKEILKALLHSN
jgi:hypothetical protein